MANRTKKEFAKTCGILTKHISIYVKRRQIIVGKDGLIDDEHEVNYAFIISKAHIEAKKSNGTAKKKPVAKKSTVKKPAVKKPVKKKPTPKPKPGVKKKPTPNQKSKPEPKPKPTAADLEKLKQIEYLVGLDTEKIEADLMLKKHNAEVMRIKVEKLQGLLIPTELVKSVIELQAEATKIAYHESIEKLVIIFSQKMKLSSADVTNVRKQLSAVVNDAVDGSVEEAQRGVKNIVKEFQKTRGVGESE